jgi:hypothetical protein
MCHFYRARSACSNLGLTAVGLQFVWKDRVSGHDRQDDRACCVLENTTLLSLTLHRACIAYFFASVFGFKDSTGILVCHERVLRA